MNANNDYRVRLSYRSGHEETSEQVCHRVTEAGQYRCKLNFWCRRNKQHANVSEVQHGTKHHVHIPKHLAD